jgi:hypothetical protein
MWSRSVLLSPMCSTTNDFTVPFHNVPDCIPKNENTREEAVVSMGPDDSSVPIPASAHSVSCIHLVTRRRDTRAWKGTRGVC